MSGERRNGEFLFNGCGVSVIEDEKSSRDDGGGCTAVWLSLVSQLKMVKMMNYMLCVFYHN